MEEKKTEQKYEEAMKRLEEIVRQIENGEMDIDSLADKLKEAKQLMAFCKQKLISVEEEVNKIMSEQTS
jgi:exodeoxyribonuclease VII small subunit